MKKSMNVKSFKDAINAMLSSSNCSSDVRRGLIASLDIVLHETGNYYGFRYLSQNEVPVGHLPGINGEINESGRFVMCEDRSIRFVNTDPTRIEYY